MAIIIRLDKKVRLSKTQAIENHFKHKDTKSRRNKI